MKAKRGRPKKIDLDQLKKQKEGDDATEETTEIPEAKRQGVVKEVVKSPKPDLKVDFFRKDFQFEPLPLTGTQRIVTDKQLILYARYILNQMRVLRVQRAFEDAKSIQMVLTVTKKGA